LQTVARCGQAGDGCDSEVNSVQPSSFDIAQPDDVADIVSALVANTYITGEVILLDGGLNLR
jgi:NAD(P)-dependent dehydrogenase (short-subunit alcohol dehydrogenase family)